MYFKWTINLIKNHQMKSKKQYLPACFFLYYQIHVPCYEQFGKLTITDHLMEAADVPAELSMGA